MGLGSDGLEEETRLPLTSFVTSYSLLTSCSVSVGRWIIPSPSRSLCHGKTLARGPHWTCGSDSLNCTLVFSLFDFSKSCNTSVGPVGQAPVMGDGSE